MDITLFHFSQITILLLIQLILILQRFVCACVRWPFQIINYFFLEFLFWCILLFSLNSPKKKLLLASDRKYTLYAIFSTHIMKLNKCCVIYFSSLSILWACSAISISKGQLYFSLWPLSLCLLQNPWKWFNLNLKINTIIKIIHD